MFVGRIQRVKTSVSTFETIITSGALYVDKTAFIEHFLDEDTDDVQILCRQRRLGKSLNLDMLYRFLTKKKDYRSLFEGLYIQKSPAWRHAHSKSVFLLDFKNLSPGGYREKIRTMIKDFLAPHLKNKPCPDSKAAAYEKWNSEQTDGSEGLGLLIDIVAELDEKPIILIDEYDKLIMDNIGDKEKYTEIRDYLTLLFSAAFKGNENLEKALMVGVTRVSLGEPVREPITEHLDAYFPPTHRRFSLECTKHSGEKSTRLVEISTPICPAQGSRADSEGMLSGLNNPKTFDVFMDSTYTQDFGFTETEVEELSVAAGFDMSEAKRWYNGVCIGGKAIYNTFGIMNMIDTGSFECYWGNTGSLKTARTMLTAERKRILTSLLEPDVRLSVEMEKRISPEQLDSSPPDSYFYSFLVQTGYLALNAQTIRTGEVSIPNEELREVWSRFILDVFLVGDMKPPLDLFNTSNVEKLAEGLKAYLSVVLDHLSYHELPYRLCSDGKRRVPEELYQHLLFGLFFSAMYSLGFERVKSNREAGDGRYDISLDTLEEVFILELKSAAEDESLDARAQFGLDQIKEKRYAAEFPEKRVTGVGVGLRKKSCAVAAELMYN